MKNLFKGALILACFAIAVSLVQISCSKSDAQTNNSNNNNNNNQNVVAQVNKILYTTHSSGTYKVWTANYDGTNPTQINIALPAGVTLECGSSDFSMYLSPDGLKIFFFGGNPITPGANSLYSCNIDGTNVVALLTSSSELFHLYGAY